MLFRSPCLVPDFRARAFSFCTVDIDMLMMLAMGLSYVVSIMLRFVLSIPSLLRTFIMKGVEFCHMHVLHLLRGSCDFFLHSINVVYHIY